ncbi:MAG: hypothetical protein ACRDRK_02630 [Pseudonocardia sp.]
MGKGARTRRKQAATTPLARWGPFFHGGVPGKDVGELLVPAARLGSHYHYTADVTTYDPGWVYATTDVGVADAYASRYLSGDGRAMPGDVYEVEPGGGMEIDPDYDMFPEAFLRCPQARVVARAVALTLTAAELGQRERRTDRHQPALALGHAGWSLIAPG